MARHELQQSRVYIIAAPLEQKSTLANLLELYSHDFSEFIDLDIGSDGRFGYRELDLYWIDADRLPFLIYVDEKLAGFSLVRSVAQGAETMWDMAEFFVMRGLRRGGIGARAATNIFLRLPGRWQVRVMRANAPACLFWSRTIQSLTGRKIPREYRTISGREWMVFVFASSAPAEP